MDDLQKKDEDGQDSKPSPLTYLIVGLFSVILGLVFKNKFKEWTEKEGVNEREGCCALYFAIWVIGAVLLALIYMGFLLYHLLT